MPLNTIFFTVETNGIAATAPSPGSAETASVTDDAANQTKANNPDMLALEDIKVDTPLMRKEGDIPGHDATAL